jgi:hypothetical protein
VTGQIREKREEEKKKRREKSSDFMLSAIIQSRRDYMAVQNDLLKTINQRATEDELNELTELSIWERMGFKSSRKQQIMLKNGR